MPVAELLQRISSPELCEWMAFEKVYGPVGNEWRDETLAAVHEQLQVLTMVMAEDFEPQKYPRPRHITDDDDEEE